MILFLIGFLAGTIFATILTTVHDWRRWGRYVEREDDL